MYLPFFKKEKKNATKKVNHINFITLLAKVKTNASPAANMAKITVCS